MKLFVWCDPYDVSYGSTMVFAVADDLAAAKAQARVGQGYSYGQYEDHKAPVTLELGEPTRIVELPCAEWHMWQE